MSCAWINTVQLRERTTFCCHIAWFLPPVSESQESLRGGFFSCVLRLGEPTILVCLSVFERYRVVLFDYFPKKFLLGQVGREWAHHDPYHL